MSSAAKFDAEKVIHGLGEARAQERQNRALAFAGLTHTVCGREILPLTPHHRLQLQLLGNGFVDFSRRPTLADVFVFLWVTSPHNVGGLEAARQQYFLREDVKAMSLDSAIVEIYRYILDQLQDTLSEVGGGEGRDNSAWIHWVAMDSAFYAEACDMTIDEYMRTPFLVLQQRSRAWKVNHPDVEYTKDGKVLTRDPVFRNRSDTLVSAFHRENKDKIKAWHLAQKTRRN